MEGRVSEAKARGLMTAADYEETCAQIPVFLSLGCSGSEEKVGDRGKTFLYTLHPRCRRQERIGLRRSLPIERDAHKWTTEGSHYLLKKFGANYIPILMGSERHQKWCTEPTRH